MTRCLCAIPVYNNAATLVDVAQRCRRYLPDVLVVDDGSTDLTPSHLDALHDAGVDLRRHELNQGKGAAILTALAVAVERQDDYLITIDADGQHFPEDLPAFLAILEQEPEVLLVGCRNFGENVPEKSKFGRAFANFWLKLETGVDCDDCQSGFRAYPVKAISQLRFLSRRYNFESEVIARAAWGGVKIMDTPIKVSYPKDRVSHFDPWRDNLRISLIHAWLVTLRLLPWRPRRVSSLPPPPPPVIQLFRHPLRSLRRLLKENLTPGGLAVSAMLGTFLAVLPIPGFHTLAIAYFATRLHVNAVLALAIQNLFMPPLTPFLCIQLGFFLRHGHFWTELTTKNVIHELHQRLFEWLLGSLILAPLFAVLAGIIVFLVASRLQARPDPSPKAS
ncbi:MAG: Undecaprenyl-phosphate mannosyltransferase [Lentisphaerae bacterium ADurb.Bin082]|nr:MAG: Undecaprenyl-phosphate mannosyltransferase [Lentisphaerae bacterium ADurb.Bin082]HQL86069.1 DUF2062 domain-containing protein [Lentisphaeria bacterium]